MREKKYTHICVTDLDGTLLNEEHEISIPNLQTLHSLADKKICRVAATGRSLYSLRKVFTPDSPFDYVIFTTGAGIMNWHTQQIILSRHINGNIVHTTFQKLLKLGKDFMLHTTIPNNHCFVAIESRGLPDFQRRIAYYNQFCSYWTTELPIPNEEGTQFLIVADNKDEHLFTHLINLLIPLKVVRTTSPLDHFSLWFEVFSPEVSKGSAVQFLLDLLGLERNNLMVIGNDYNDNDMLVLTPHSYVTANAPAELQKAHKIVSDYNNHGFAEAVSNWLSALGI